MSYQYQWVPLLQGSRKYILGKRDIGGAGAWLNAANDEIPALMRRADLLDFHFVRGKRPEANRFGRFATTMEWARRLTERDIDILTGKVPYSDTMPNIDEGFAEQDLTDPQKRIEAMRTIRERMFQAVKEKKGPYWVREVPADDVKGLQHLAGHVRVGMFITKFRKIFTRG
ncbi:MAG TPA: hypothetical protein VEL76_12335, partial [Gemmataceae bacterium]|nr:hypothetical protein [Gemmataceae bacterium]